MRKTGAPVSVSDGYAVAASGLIHRVWEPSSPGPHKSIVMLHGRSGNEDVMWIFAKTAPPDWLLVAPRGIHSDRAGGYIWLPRAKDEWPTLSQFDDAVTAVSQFINTLPELYEADPKQIYLMGFSQGAAVSYATAIHHPDLIAGVASLVGFIPVDCGPSLEISPLKSLPIFMANGKRDPLIPLSRTASCAQTLTMAGAQLDYHEYDTGHKLNSQGFEDLTGWWLARDAEPLIER
jgi:phospholipase/carboxylesterase